jgi:predicted DNA-binding transcriptional regulator YafY
VTTPLDVIIDYTNWKGERRERRIQPYSIDFCAEPMHPEPQWVLYAFDLEKKEYRSFAMKDIHSWRPV